LIWSNYTTGISIGGYDTTVGRTLNCVITHNTFYHNNTLQNGNGEMEFQYAPATNTITHNIFSANMQNLFFSDSYAQNSGNIVDWNLYFARGGVNGSTWVWKNTTYTGFTAYKTGTTNDAHSLFADPLFINSTNGNFHLATNSPAVNSGDPNFESLTNQAGETDIDIQSRTALGRTDIGADELNLLSAMLGIGSATNNQLQLRLAGEPGHPFVWEQSATLSGWSPFLTNYADSTGRMFFTSSVAAGARFFRASMTQ
jgi:hypothetical protein